MINEISECKTCGAEIVWMKTRNDKNIPVDLPDADDTRADLDSREEVLASKLYNRERMKTHFETCPQSDQHRKPKSTHAPAPAGDATLNAKRLNAAMAILQDIVAKPADGMRAIELARAGLAQIRAIR